MLVLARPVLAQLMSIDMSEPEKLARVDFQYVMNQTLVGDLKILTATLMLVKRTARI